MITENLRREFGDAEPENGDEESLDADDEQPYPAIDLRRGYSWRRLLRVDDPNAYQRKDQAAIEGPTWAEEDIELPIALAFLHCLGHIDDDKLWLPAEKLYEAAMKNATDYERYKAAADLLTHQIAQAKATLPLTA